MNEYIAMWKNYVNFSDRTTRRGYWMAILFNVIASIIISIISAIIKTNILSTIYSIAVFIPGLAICIRRLRDIGKPWGWIFISFIPLVGAIWLIVLFCQDSVPADGTPVV